MVKEIITVNVSKGAKRKSTSGSGRADKSAKITEAGSEKTTIDTDEPQPIETAKKSKAKDPNAPKKPLQVYILYSNANRAQVAEENPSFTFGEIVKELGKRYREATPEELQPYQAQYDESMKTYKKELEEYNKMRSGGNDDEKDVEENNKEKNETKTTKKGKNKNEIRRNISAYMHFSMSKGPELKERGIKPPESGKVLGTLWRELPESEKAEFEEIAQKDKERYLKEVEDAKASTAHDV